MRHVVRTIVFFLAAVASAQFGTPNAFPNSEQEQRLIQKPEFYTMEWDQGKQLVQKRTPLYIEVDSLGRQDVFMLVDTKNVPVLYASDISTPVCSDGLCELMHIRTYWNLLGKYAGFDRYPDLPLTKYEHEEFLPNDYLKLHVLLKDNNSILKRKEIDELVEEPEEPKIESVDAVAGATITEVKESVVSGALYSCYTAWHLVHGAVKDEIKDHTLSLLNDDMVLNMLHADDTDYQLFALKNIGEDQYGKNYKRIAEIFKTGIPLVRTFIIKNLPDSFWASEKLQTPFWDSFAQVDINSRSLLLEHLDKAPEPVVEDLSTRLGAMTKNQLKAYLQYLAGAEAISPFIKENLIVFSNIDAEIYAYITASFLEDRE